MRKGSKRLILLGVGILLLLLGLRGVALAVIGKSAQATVTRVRQAAGPQDDPMDHNYQLSYRFSVEGNDYTGNFGLKKVYNAATLPSVGATVPVRYLPAAPAINGGPDSGPLGSVFLGGLGMLLLFLGARPAKPPTALAQTEEPDADRAS